MYYRWEPNTGGGGGAYSSQHSDLFCTSQSRNHEDADNFGLIPKDKVSLKVLYIFKYIMIALSLVFLPFLIFKTIIVPLKILMGVKVISMVNSFLLATLLFKYSAQQKQQYQLDNNIMDTTNEQSEPMDNVLMNAMDFENAANSDNINTAEENAKRIYKMLQKKYNKW